MTAPLSDPYATGGATGLSDPYAEAPPRPVPASAPKGSYDHARLRALWTQAGGDPKDAEIMARVAYAESTGNPNAINSYVENGKTYHPRGLWQVSDIHSHGSTFDPLENARAAVELHRARGFSPWEASRKGGAGGGWGQYLVATAEKLLPAGPPVRPGAAAAWKALNAPLAGTAAADPLHSAPPKDPYATGVAMPPQGPRDHPSIPAGDTPATYAAKQKALADKNAAAPPHSPIEQASGIVDAPLVTAGGAATGELGKAFELWLRNPAEANAQYGFLSKPILEKGAAGGNTTAKYLLEHPAQAAIGQGVAELFNPVNDLVGGVLTKAGGVFVGVVSKTPQGRALLNAFSPLRGIAANGGQVAKRAVQAMMVRVTSQPAKAQQAALRIFGDLSPQAMDDVIHVYQGSTKYVHETGGAALGVIRARADMLREYLAGITQGKLDADLIAQQTARDNPTHFPLSTLFERTTAGRVEEQAAQFDRELRGAAGGGSSPITRETTEHTQAVHHSLASADHALANDPALQAIFHRHPDWSPPVALAKFAARSEQNISLEASFKALPPTLRRDMVPEDFGIQGYFKRTPFEKPDESLAYAREISGGAKPKPPLDGRGRAMRAYDDLPPELQRQLVDSPVLRRSWLSQDFISYLQKNSTRLYREPDLYPAGKDAGSVLVRGALKAWDGYNNTMRAAIVANPLVHPLWNLTNNALGAGLPLHEVAGLAARSIFSTLGQGRTVDRIVNFFDKDWSSWVDEAARAGALAEMKEYGSSAALTRAAKLPNAWKAWADPNASITDKFSRAVEGARAWNTRLTFGVHGEEAFATALYRRMMQSGKFSGDGSAAAIKAGQEEAAGLVREALGNYANVDQHGVEGAASRLMFFYPWLKGNTAFWVRKFAQNPRATLTPADMARTNNALSGDPTESGATRAQDYRFKHKGFGGPTIPALSVFGHKISEAGPIGGDPSQFYSYTPLLPQRILTDVESFASGSPERATKAAMKIGAGHLQPIPRMATEGLLTAYSQPADPGQAANFTTVYDRDAPAQTQWHQIESYAISHGLPIPLVGFQVGDAVRQGGVAGAEVGPMALGAVGGGYARPETAGSAEDKQVKRARSRLTSALIKASKISKNIAKKDPARADERLRTASAKAYATYEAAVERARNKGRTKRQAGSVVDAPPGL